jgi:hypothetical protein
MAGVFISRGMTVGIPAGGLKIGIGPDGKPIGSLALHVHFDVCPTWVELALGHLKEAKDRGVERVAAWAAANEDAKASTLEREFESSMQAVMSSAIAIDAFYAVLQKKVAISAATLASWRRNRTARHSQVAEVLRIAFGVKGKALVALKHNLQEIYRLRDLAVHPSGQIDAPILHPELLVGVEWRFAYFRHQNADLIVRAAVTMLIELATSGKPKDSAVRQYAEALRARLSGVGAALDTFTEATQVTDFKSEV